MQPSITPTRLATYAATLLSLSLAAAPVLADPSSALDRASISVGAFYTDPHIDINADTHYGHIDSGSYQTDHATLPRVKAQLLLGSSQGLDFDYYNYDKTYNPTLSGSTNIDGLPLTGTGTLNAKLKLDLANLAYKWWLGSGDDVFGVGVGAAYYHARIDGTANGILNGITGNTQYSENDSAFAPLVELGWRHAFSQQLRVFADASGIRKNGGNISGHIYGGTIGVEWYATPNIGLVADYSTTKISLNRDNSNTNLDLRLNGPAAYVKFRF